MPRANPLPPPLSGDAYRISIYTVNQGQVCINSFDYMGSAFTVGPSLNMSALLADFQAAVELEYRNVLASTSQITRYSIACISSNAPVTIDTFVNIPGNVPGPSLPIEMSTILKKTSSLKGQHGRGRNYIPAIPVTFTTPATTPNYINALGRAAYVLLCNALNAGFVVGGTSYDLVITPRPIPPATVVTTAAVVVNVLPVDLLATQRRRREGRGI